MYILII